MHEPSSHMKQGAPHDFFANDLESADGNGNGTFFFPLFDGNGGGVAPTMNAAQQPNTFLSNAQFLAGGATLGTNAFQTNNADENAIHFPDEQCHSCH